jgi:hypothetical protein
VHFHNLILLSLSSGLEAGKAVKQFPHLLNKFGINKSLNKRIILFIELLPFGPYARGRVPVYLDMKAAW